VDKDNEVFVGLDVAKQRHPPSQLHVPWISPDHLLMSSTIYLV